MDKLDWGQVTPEGVNAELKEYLFVFNHDISSYDKIERTIRFIVGRLQYCDNHLPKESVYSVKIDTRGQDISLETTNFISMKIKTLYSKKTLLTIDFINT